MIIVGLQVLLRALRDFNLGKLTADDTSIFMGLLNDLFPKTVELVPRAIDHEFEGKVSNLNPLHADFPCMFLDSCGGEMKNDRVCKLSASCYKNHLYPDPEHT